MQYLTSVPVQYSMLLRLCFLPKAWVQGPLQYTVKHERVCLFVHAHTLDLFPAACFIGAECTWSLHLLYVPKTNKYWLQYTTYPCTWDLNSGTRSLYPCSWDLYPCTWSIYPCTWSLYPCTWSKCLWACQSFAVWGTRCSPWEWFPVPEACIPVPEASVYEPVNHLLYEVLVAPHENDSLYLKPVSLYLKPISLYLKPVSMSLSIICCMRYSLPPMRATASTTRHLSDSIGDRVMLHTFWIKETVPQNIQSSGQSRKITFP